MDPVSWLQIEQGWRVVGSDGGLVGTVAQVEGDKQADVFDGLAVVPTEGSVTRYIPGEQVGPIYPGEVTLTIAVADAHALAAFTAPPPETQWVLGKAPLGRRLLGSLRGGPPPEGISSRPIGGSETQQPQGQSWFGPKRYGFGRRPVTWQGWVVVIAVTVIIILAVALR